MEGSNYPVVAAASADPKLSRLLIFVKFILLIPHFIVLYGLQIAHAAVCFIAWFAILFTGRYPKALFNFSVGVMRWGLRVNTYFMLLTDKYPPFSFENEPEFPATLEVAYPERLSRLLIFVKWLLLIPHYFVIMFLLIALYFIMIISWFAILFTGKYPEGLSNFVIGFLRWNLRVSAYMMLLTDRYPPFSLE